MTGIEIAFGVGLLVFLTGLAGLAWPRTARTLERKDDYRGKKQPPCGPQVPPLPGGPGEDDPREVPRSASGRHLGGNRRKRVARMRRMSRHWTGRVDTVAQLSGYCPESPQERRDREERERLYGRDSNRQGSGDSPRQRQGGGDRGTR